MEKKYDIFISYRRNGGSERAELLKAIFVKKGIDENRIFMDTHSLKGGDFQYKIQNALELSSNVVVLVTDGCFVSSDEFDYWFYEIAEALKLKKNIIPVFFDGIKCIDVNVLPQQLSGLSNHNAVTYSHEYADAFFERLISFLSGCNLKKRNMFEISAKFILFAFIVFILTISSLVYLFSTQLNVDSCTLNYVEKNGIKEIDAKINGIGTKMIIDPAATYSTISLAEFKYLSTKGLITDEDVIGTELMTTAASDTINELIIIIKELSIDKKFTFKNVRFGVFDNDKAPVLLGNDVLNRFSSYTIDNENKTIHFENR